ncbi:MAG TPA: hypothetical protein VL371_08715 [Gemmataceae bacterium]|jgi:hypothetical protein|nr:hypothetical protein [Gemmataceae bacterium]
MKLFSTPRRRRIGWTALAVALVLLVWLLWPNRNLARVRALQGELFGEAGKALSPEQRQEKFNALREATRNLSPAQRDELARDGMRRQSDQMARYVKMTPQEKRRYLDEQINRQEEMRRRMQQQPAANGNGPAGAPGGLGMASGTGGRGNRPPPTAEEKEKRRKQMLDRTTPELRENRDQFRRDMEARRQQRGLPPTPSGGGRGRR